MTRSRLIFLCALVLVAAGVVALWQSGPKEPVYQGKKLSELIRESREYNPDREQRNHARAIIKATGSNALPYLMSEFTRSESRWSSLIHKLTRTFNRPQIRYTTEDRATLAAGGIYLLGSNATSAIPTLTGYLNQKMRGVDAATALAGMGELTLPVLLGACASTNPLMVSRGTHGLNVMVVETEAAIPPLIQMTLHSNLGIRFAAINGLTRARSRLDLVIPTLTNLLSDTDSNVRRSAANALSRFGETGKPAVPFLLSCLQSTNHLDVRWASNALYKIDPTALPRAAAP